MFDFLKRFSQVGEEAGAQIGGAKKTRISEKCVVKLINDVRDIETYGGILTPDRRFMFIQELERVAIKPEVYRENGIQTVYLPEDTHGQVRFKNLEDIALAQKYDILIRWTRLENFKTTKTEFTDRKKYDELMKKLDKEGIPYAHITATGSIDWSVFNNPVSPNLSIDAFLVAHSKILQFLKETANWKLILMCLACLFIGMFFGFVISGILDIILGAVLGAFGGGT